MSFVNEFVLGPLIKLPTSPHQIWVGLLVWFWLQSRPEWCLAEYASVVKMFMYTQYLCCLRESTDLQTSPELPAKSPAG